MIRSVSSVVVKKKSIDIDENIGKADKLIKQKNKGSDGKNKHIDNKNYKALKSVLNANAN